jgi:hypothetical protein
MIKLPVLVSVASCIGSQSLFIYSSISILGLQSMNPRIISNHCIVIVPGEMLAGRYRRLPFVPERQTRAGDGSDIHLSGAGETKYHGQDTPHCIQYPAGTQWRGIDLIGWVPVGEMITEISFSQVIIVGVLAG